MSEPKKTAMYSGRISRLTVFKRWEKIKYRMECVVGHTSEGKDIIEVVVLSKNQIDANVTAEVRLPKILIGCTLHWNWLLPQTIINEDSGEQIVIEKEKQRVGDYDIELTTKAQGLLLEHATPRQYEEVVTPRQAHASTPPPLPENEM